MTDFEKKMISVANFMIDGKCEVYGVVNTIHYLMDFGFTEDELLEMMFDKHDVDEAIEEDGLAQEEN